MAQLTPLRGGQFSYVYAFQHGGQDCVLRLTPPNGEIDERSTQAALAWMDFLARHGASVPRPIPSRHGRLIESIEDTDGRYVVTAAYKVHGVLAQELAPQQWSDTLYQRLGQTIGKMHALSRSYVPSGDVRRPAWDALGTCFNPSLRLDPLQAAVHEQRERIVRRVRMLPTSPDGYGLVHSDLHFANILVDVEHEVMSLLDFDDCAYGWYMMDIVLPLLDILVLRSEADQPAFAAHFLEQLLSGYLTENALPPFWIQQAPAFLTLLETGLYIQLHDDYDPHTSAGWVGAFMANRRARIEQGRPFIDLDWVGILETARRRQPAE
jgi:Ser/Thr protein kinase RdoA (MazF antagonist)